MENMKKLEVPSGTSGTEVAERRKARRYHLLTRVDMLVAGFANASWGSVLNMSWTGVALSVRQHLQPGRTVTIRFRFQDEDRCEVTESLTAKIIWRSGDNMGLEFDPPLATGSPALRQAPFLVAHLMMKDA